MRGLRVSVPIALTIALVTIAIALTVGWQILVVRDGVLESSKTLQWLLVSFGSLAFVAIIAVAITLAAWLVREIRNNQRQQNFIDAVTHELHTPLASLQLYLDTLAGSDLDAARRKEFFGIMGEDLGRLRRTIDQILAAARQEVRPSRRETVDLARLLRECVDESLERHDLEPKHVHLDVPAGARVRGDAAELRLVFRNLLENAIRYSGDPIDVDVAVRLASARKLAVEVTDRGVGIPPTALSRVFQRFQRISTEGLTTRGLGLGLYIVRNIIRGHGGSVRAESEGPGAGSRFIVTLPGQLGPAPDHGTAHPAR